MKFCIVFIFMMSIAVSLTAQETVNEGYLLSDKRLASEHILKHESQKPYSISGLFISPNIGISFPIQDFGKNSRAAFTFGGKIEFASSELFPFFIGGYFQYQKHSGAEEFKATNRIEVFETTITQFGGSVDVLLTQLLPNYFTMPVASLEVGQLSIKRVVTPAENNPDLLLSDSKIGVSAGLGFTIFIFDIVGKYTYAGEYSSININTRFHFPLIKF